MILFNLAYLFQSCLSRAANEQKLSNFMQNAPPKLRTYLFPAINIQPFPGLELQCYYVMFAKEGNLIFEFSFKSASIWMPIF